MIQFLIRFVGVEVLIGEIERFNKKARTFASWIAGLSATFIILLATLATNSFMKLLDMYLKVMSTDELSNMPGNLNQIIYTNHNILSYVDFAFALLFIFIIVILIYTMYLL